MADYYGFAAPILPGQLDAWKRMAKEMTGTRKKEYSSSRKKSGVKHERAWLQHTPMGDFVVVYLEGKNAEKAMDNLAASKDPFDQWFSKQISAIHGLTGPPPANELFVDIL